MDPIDFILGNVDDRKAQIARAEALRAANQQKLKGAIDDANQFDTLQAVAPLMNNPALMQAANVLAKNAQSQAPKMGATGALLPSGEYVENPVYTQEREDSRLSQAQNALATQLGLMQRAGDANALKQTLAMLSDSTRRSIAYSNQQTRLLVAALGLRDKADKDKERQDKIFNDNVTKYAATLEKGGIPEFHNSLSLAENTLNQYKPGDLPGYGRFESAMPNWALSTEGQKVRSDMQQLANTLLKARSGTAVSDSEQRRFLNEVAMGNGMSEDALRNGFINIRNQFNAKALNATSGFAPEILDAYAQRGGVDLRGLRPGAPPSPKGSTATGAGAPKRLKFNPQTGTLE